VTVWVILMAQLAPLTYEKREERVLVRSFLTGIFLGLPLGILVNLLLGFPTINVAVPVDSVGGRSSFSCY
jgi:hypothetical protein